VKSDLDELIESLEIEEQSLNKLIEACLKERDYLGAHYHSIALDKVNHQLQVFNSFKGSLYSAKLGLQMMMEDLDNINIDPNLAEYVRRHWETRIEEQKEKIAKLSLQKDRPLYDDQKIDDALFDLFNGVCKGFKLILESDESLCLNFEISEINILNIIVHIPEEMYDDYSLNDYSERTIVQAFEGLGFKLNDNGDLAYKYDIRDFKDATIIKMLLARIIYDTLFYGQYANVATLEYY